MKIRTIIPAAAAIFLCSCTADTDNRIENTDILETEITTITKISATEPVTSAEDVTLTEPVPEQNSKVLDSLDLYSKRLELHFTGTEGDYGKYRGTLELKCFEQNDFLKGDETGSYTIYDNTEFSLTPPSNDDYYGLVMINSEIAALTSVQGSPDSRRYFRFFEIEKDGSIIPFTVFYDEEYSDIIADEYHVLADDFKWSTNQYIQSLQKNEGWNSLYLNDSIHICYDYASTRYVEYGLDCASNKVIITGTLDWKSDEDITYAASKAYSRALLIGGTFYNSYIYDYLGEEISRNDEREECYYRLSDEIASDKEELLSFAREGFSQRYIEKNLADIEEAMFGGEYPPFYEDEEGIIYAERYRGVPLSFDFDTVRVTERSDNSITAIVGGHSLDECVFREMIFIRENGQWVLDEHRDGVLGKYFSAYSSSKSDGNGYQWLISDFYPFGQKAGDTVSITFTLRDNSENGKLYASADGAPVVFGIEKREDFDGIDISALSTENPIRLPSDGYDYTGEYTMDYTNGEPGVYVFWAGCRYADEDEEYTEILMGPQIFHVEE